MTIKAPTIACANTLYKHANWVDACREFMGFLWANPALVPFYLVNLTLVKQHFVASSGGEAQSVGIFCWNTANNALGRTVTLADCYKAAGYDCQLLGCVPYPRWHKVWPPLAHISQDITRFELAEHSRLLSVSCQFVLQHPLHQVHISKPRLPGIVLGLLYKLIWGASVIVDIDDEELAFLDKTQPGQAEATALQLNEAVWTELAVSLVPCFDAVTVSNPALQQRYGGVVIPHARCDQPWFHAGIAV